MSSGVGSDDEEDIVLESMFKKKSNEPEPQPVGKRGDMRIQNTRIMISTGAQHRATLEQQHLLPVPNVRTHSHNDGQQK